MTKLNIALSAAALLAVALFWLFPPAEDFTPAREPDAMIGEPLAQLALPSLYVGGKMLKTNALKGHVTLINIFASWCAPCQAEHPLLMTLAAQPVVMVGIAYKDKVADAQRVLTQSGNPFAILARDDEGRVRNVFGSDGVPETYILDKDGIIRFRHAGALTETVIQSQILPLIANLNRATYPSATTGR